MYEIWKDGEFISGQQYKDTALEIGKRLSKYGEIEVKSGNGEMIKTFEQQQEYVTKFDY